MLNINEELPQQNKWRDLDVYLRSLINLLFKESTLPTKTHQSRIYYLYKECDLILNLRDFLGILKVGDQNQINTNHLIGCINSLTQIIILTLPVKDKSILKNFKYVVDMHEYIVSKIPESIQLVYYSFLFGILQEDSSKRYRKIIQTETLCHQIIKCLGIMSEKVKHRKDNFSVFYFNVIPSFIQNIFAIELKGDTVFASNYFEGFQKEFKEFKLKFIEKSRKNLQDIKLSKRLKSTQKNETLLEIKNKEKIQIFDISKPIDIFIKEEFEKSFYIFLFLFQIYFTKQIQFAEFRQKQNLGSKNIFEEILNKEITTKTDTNNTSSSVSSKLMLFLAYDFNYKTEFIQAFLKFVNIDIEASLNKQKIEEFNLDMFQISTVKQIIFFIFMLRVLETKLYFEVEHLNNTGKCEHAQFLVKNMVSF